VPGAADTLQAQVGIGDQVRDMTLSPAFDEEGVYESVFIPTQPGDYTFRFFGQLEGVAVDETFTSSPEGFDSVAPRADFEFPAASTQGTGEDRDAIALSFPMIAGGLVLGLGVLGAVVRRRSA
jgi:hypothetical protein